MYNEGENNMNGNNDDGIIKPLLASEKTFGRIGSLLEPEKWSVIKVPDPERVPNSAAIFHKTYVEELAKEIKRAEKFVYIVSGELCSKVWSDPRIVESFIDSKANDIKILCGPVIDIASIEVLKLVETNKIRLYFTKKRKTAHFVVTDKAVVMEQHHAKFTATESVFLARGSKKSVRLFKYDFYMVKRLKKKIAPEKILNIFSPKIFSADIKESNRDPAGEEITKFLAEIEVRLNYEEETKLLSGIAADQ